MTKDPLKMVFAELIQFCKDEKILSDKAVSLSIILKDFRNLIHPGRALRRNEVADEQGAIVARALAEIIVAEVASRRRESYGYTADQICAKICQDTSAMSIIEHLFEKTKPSRNGTALAQEYTFLLLSVTAVRHSEAKRVRNLFQISIRFRTRGDKEPR